LFDVTNDVRLWTELDVLVRTMGVVLDEGATKVEVTFEGDDKAEPSP